MVQAPIRERICAKVSTGFVFPCLSHWKDPSNAVWRIRGFCFGWGEMKFTFSKLAEGDAMRKHKLSSLTLHDHERDVVGGAGALREFC